MLHVFAFSSLFLFSCLGLANPRTPLYQVDMIVFTHLQASLTPSEQSLAPLLPPDSNQAILLQNNGTDRMTPYHILPTSASQLRNEYRALSRKPQYQVLFHYTWLQPSNNQRPIALSQTIGGWNVEGTLKIRQSNYYLLDTQLLFSAPNSTQMSFLFSQKQRLKAGVTYYLDHPQAGMLIKVHQIT